MKCLSLLYDKKVHLAPNTKIVPAEEFSKLVEAETILTTLRKDLAQFKQELFKEAETIKEQKAKEGFEEGLARFNQHVLAMDHSIEQLRQEMREHILPLALKAARKLVGEELKLHPDRIVDIVLNSLKSVTQHKKIKIYVHKSDLNELEAHRPRIKAIFEHLQQLSIQERDDLEPGGCIIETEAGIINAQLETQWRALEAAFQSFRPPS
jgi:type III secretion protein L